jgi:hypothetical protein
MTTNEDSDVEIQMVLDEAAFIKYAELLYFLTGGNEEQNEEQNQETIE